MECASSILAFVSWFAVGIGVQQHESSWDAVLFDELIELYPDTSLERGSKEHELDCARGVIAGVHLLLAGLSPERPLELEITEGGHPIGGVTWYRMHAVPVEENTGLRSRTEVFDGQSNPYVIRRAPFEVFEALQPIPPRFSAWDDQMALRAELYIDPQTVPRTRSLQLRVKSLGEQRKLRWKLRIHAAVVPPVSESHLDYTNWFSLTSICKWHSVDLWSEPFWELLRLYAELMHKGRQNTFWVRWQDMFERDAGAWRLQEDRLVRYINVFFSAGLTMIEGAPFARRPNADWSRPRLELWSGELATDAAGLAVLESACRQLDELLQRKSWKAAWIQHIADEPTDTNAADYAKLAGYLREYFPGVRVVEATMSRELAGAVDIWCPQVQKYQAHQDFFEQQRRRGNHLWVYTCLIPGGPWLNRLLDQERLRQVYLGWAAAKYDLHGYLHWGLNHYKADPFAQSVVDHPQDPGGKNKLPAGDSHIFYPGADGPWSGHRFECHRIGMEDFELLHQLRKQNNENRARLIRRVIQGFDSYSVDVRTYRKTKKELLLELAGRN